MTQVTISTFDRNGVRYRCLRAENHAGDDRVCAGISAICFALAGYLLNRESEGLEYSLIVGDAEITAKDTAVTQEAFMMAEIGLRQIEQTYGDYIHVDVNT